MKIPKRFPRRRRTLKSAMLLTSLAVLGLFLSAVVIGYLNSGAPKIPTVKHQTPSQSANASPLVANSAGQGDTSQTAKPEGVRSSRPGNRSTRSARAATRTSPPRALVTQSRRNRSTITETVASRDKTKQKSSSDPKLTAILKTTWKVLKKPFDF